ncbi:MAG: dihydrofolate reductase [Candidatus Nanohaloarchaea archaeon]|nr:dihydrofolate reductase [Candidatus Nanohaloarchaea archaeon]
MELVAIAAVARNGVIGRDGSIPWDYPEDLQHFKETTMGHPVILGRGTWESFGHGPLDGRTNIVISHDDLDLPDGVVNVHSIDAAVDAAAETGDDVAYVIGGESIYRQFLEQDLLDRMILTEIPERPDGDTYFPDWDVEDWDEVEREEAGELEIVTYERR